MWLELANGRAGHPEQLVEQFWHEGAGVFAPGGVTGEQQLGKLGEGLELGHTLALNLFDMFSQHRSRVAQLSLPRT